MSTFAALKTRVSDELNRADLTSQISSAVTRAIEFYADERFSFNEGRSTVVTVADNQYVTLPTGLRKIDSIYATVGGHTYEMVKREFDALELWHGASDSKGQPLDYAVRDTRFRIYPTPDQAYTLIVTGIYDETALSADGDTNGWCSGVYQDLITARARYTISRDILFDREGMEHSRLAEVEALKRARAEDNELVSDNLVSPGW